MLLGFSALLAVSLTLFMADKQIFLPSLDDGSINVRVSGDPGTAMETMDAVAQRLEKLFRAQRRCRLGVYHHRRFHLWPQLPANSRVLPRCRCS